jgi:HK97 gp10 family phage protein
MTVLVTLDMRGLLAAMASSKANAPKMVEQTAYKVEAFAKIKAPVDTGALMNSLNSEKIRDLSWNVQDGVPYGIYQELGTYKMAAQPFLIPAVEQVEGQLVSMWRSLFA